MPIAEWENLTLLVSLQGNLALNIEQPEGFFLTAKDGAESGTDVRATSSPVPQSDGSILNRGFLNGYIVKIPVQYWVDRLHTATKETTPTAQEMDDTLMRHVRSLMNGGGRILYSPAGQNQRLLDSLRFISKAALTEGDGRTGTVITLASEFPYLQDFDQTLTQLTAGSPLATIVNDGSSKYFPVFKVYGPFDDFYLESTADGGLTYLAIEYDDSLPGAVPVGGGDYIEINTFNNTVYLNGSGASRKAGIKITTSEFFALEPGSNTVDISSGGTAPTVDILWAPAWV